MLNRDARQAAIIECTTLDMAEFAESFRRVAEALRRADALFTCFNYDLAERDIAPHL